MKSYGITSMEVMLPDMLFNSSYSEISKNILCRGVGRKKLEWVLNPSASALQHCNLPRIRGGLASQLPHLASLLILYKQLSKNNRPSYLKNTCKAWLLT